VAYDLAVFGGTGQWILLELLLRQLRGEQVNLPRNIWIVDPHQSDLAGSLPALLRSTEPRAGVKPTRIRPKRDARLTTTFDAVLDDELQPPAQYESLRRLLNNALTEFERTYPTEDGFFALPRLAASWIAFAEFEPPPLFLTEKYLQSEDDLLIITGSLAGGTGAGLIPQTLLRTRAAEPDHWKRTVVVQAVLPWFNPELSPAAGTGETVRWSQCTRNAADGVRALKRITDDIDLRAPAGKLDLPETLCSIAAIDPETARITPPPDHRRVEVSGVAPAFIRAVADSLLHLAEERDAVMAAAARKVVFGPATIPVPDGTVDPMSQYSRRDGFVAQQLNALHREVTAKKEAVVSRRTISLHRGFGTALGKVFLARSLTGYTNKTPQGTTAWKLFWDAWLQAIEQRARSLNDGKSGGEAVAEDVDRTIKTLDRAFAADDEMSKLLDAADEQPASAAASGRRIAGQFADALLRSEAEWTRDTVAYLYLVPGIAISPTRAAAAARLQPFEDEDVRRLADSYDAVTFTSFHGSSYARTLGTAHKLADLLHSNNAQDVARSISSWALSPLMTLWRAAVRGLLTFDERPIDRTDKIIARLIRNEMIDKDLGESITTVSFQALPVGFVTMELGFVPHVELIDELGRDVSVRERFEQLSALMPSDADDDHAILRAFAQFAIERKGASADVAWTKLLLASSKAVPGAVVDLLTAWAMPSRPVRLRLSRDGSAAELPLPLGIDALTLNALRAIAGSQRASDLFVARDDGVLEFNALGLREELGRYSLVSGRRYVTRIFPQAIRQAARFVEADGTAADTLVVSHWR